MNVDDHFDVHMIHLPEGRRCLVVNAGDQGTERIVPPAGEECAFDRRVWKRRVEVYASRTGRSVRVWVDGEEVAQSATVQVRASDEGQTS